MVSSTTDQERLATRFGVLPLQPERPHGGATADGVEQLLLLGAGGDALLGVERHRPPDVPACRVHLDGHGEQRGEQEPPVEHRERAEGEHDGEQ